MHQEMLEKINSLKETDRFLVTMTAFDQKEEKWDTYVFTNDFPYGELDETYKMIGKLIEEQKSAAQSK